MTFSKQRPIYFVVSFLSVMDVLCDESQILQPFAGLGSEIKGELERQTSEGKKKEGESKTWNPRPAPAFISGVPVI